MHTNCMREAEPAKTLERYCSTRVTGHHFLMQLGKAEADAVALVKKQRQLVADNEAADKKKFLDKLASKEKEKKFEVSVYEWKRRAASACPCEANTSAIPLRRDALLELLIALASAERSIASRACPLLYPPTTLTSCARVAGGKGMIANNSTCG